ncbi:MAG: PadR family transcriptional regulator [Chloroflexi bacterium]|nr:PadR family transcriptional regulator [Chloroflexota bacterium]
MSIQHALLGLLDHQPRHGYQLKQQFDRLFSPNRPLPFGQVYASLARLERDGRVVVNGVERAEGPDRKRYSITDGGRSALLDWLAEPLAPEPHLQAELYTKVVLAILVELPLDELLDAQRRAHLERMRELTTMRRNAPLATALLADYATYHLEADLRWLEMTSARIDDLRTQIRNEARA